MTYLMHIGFDNSKRLWKKIYYFKYKDVKYKLIQNDVRKNSDVLLTILPNDHDKKAENKAYNIASEYLSALSYENNSQVSVHNIGGAGYHYEFKLRNAKCRIYALPRIPVSGVHIGYDICTIPSVETEEQRNALVLFREAMSSNNDYLAFLFYWQVLEVGTSDPIGWINSTYRRHRRKIRVSNDEFGRLPLAGKTLGHYFYDDCRNAIAHIPRRYAGRVRIRLDNPEDNKRIAISTRVIKEFASFYIKHNLQLQNKMYLVRKRGKGFPVYINQEEVRNYPYTIAYRKPLPRL